MNYLRTISIVSLAMLALAACSSHMQPAPVGIGSGPNELKQSPCACAEIPQKPFDLNAYLSERV
jgi:hypothetical protein